MKTLRFPQNLLLPSLGGLLAIWSDSHVRFINVIYCQENINSVNILLILYYNRRWPFLNLRFKSSLRVVAYVPPAPAKVKRRRGFPFLLSELNACNYSISLTINQLRTLFTKL